METQTLFPVANKHELLDVLVLHGFHLPLLREMGYGVCTWLSPSSVYSVDVEVQESETFAPFSITIYQRDLDNELIGSDLEMMAQCELGADFSVRFAQFQNGMPADLSSFVTYLRMVLDDIDNDPVMTPEYDVDGDVETMLGMAPGESDEVYA